IRQQIDVIDPLVIVTLGRYSMNMFFPNARISNIHGQPKYGVARAYYPLFHPAAVLRDDNLRPVMADDFARLLDVIVEVKRRREAGIPENDTGQQEQATSNQSAETVIDEAMPEAVTEEDQTDPEKDPNAPK